MDAVAHISRLVYYAIILWHDYCSWEKEEEAYHRGGSTFLVNAVHVEMLVHNVDSANAKKLLWNEIVKFEEQYCEARDMHIKEQSPGPETIRWFGLLELGLAGNAYWSARTPRYNKSAPPPPTRANGVKAASIPAALKAATDRDEIDDAPDSKNLSLRKSAKRRSEVTNGEKARVLI
jgi:hypothetical protein